MPRKLQPGDTVTCKQSVEAYYSAYAGLPEQWFMPGMVGTVAVVNSPNVRGPYQYSHVVDFEGAPYGAEPHVTTTWRVALHDDNTVKIRPKNP